MPQPIPISDRRRSGAGTLALNKTAGLNAIGGNLAINTTGKITFGAANQIPDTSAVTMSDAGSVLNGSAANAGFANIAETIASLTVTGGSFNNGTGIWTVTGAASFTGGAGNTIYVGHSSGQFNVGSLSLTDISGTVSTVTVTNNTFTVHGGSSVAQTVLTVGSGGLALNNSVLNLRRGGTGGNLGSKLVLNGDVSVTGTTASFILENSNTGTPNGTRNVELGSAGTVARVIDVLGTASLTISVPVLNGGATTASIEKTGAGTLTLSNPDGTIVNAYNGGSIIKAGTLSGTTNAAAFGTGTITIGDSVGSANATLSGGAAACECHRCCLGQYRRGDHHFFGGDHLQWHGYFELARFGARSR